MTMASYRDQAFFLSLALFLAILTTAPYVAHGTVTVTVAGIRAYGTLYCPRTGPILVGANVTLSCSNISASVLTNQNGFFDITLIPPVDVSLGFDLTMLPVLANCIVTVPLPLPLCRALPRIIGTPIAVGLSIDQAGALLDAAVYGFTFGRSPSNLHPLV